ncbi:MAG TPA: hypothetical protein VEJ36_02215 [Nitrososphaerales archaeon]|nr:hypothetical protein [Nitrososphaerales archaeon]
MTCRICRREAVAELCQYHEDARSRIEECYPIWKDAFGQMSHEEYLLKIRDHDQSGEWVKEVAALMIVRAREEKVPSSSHSG